MLLGPSKALTCTRCLGCEKTTPFCNQSSERRAEDASEADKLSSDDKGGYYRGYFAMLLCRVTLGNVQMLQSPDPKAHECVGPDQDGLLLY